MLILAQFLVFIALNFENLFTKNQHNLTEVLLEKLNWFLIHALKSNFKLCLVVNFLMTYSFFYNISNSKGFFYFNSRKKITQFLRNLTTIPLLYSSTCELQNSDTLVILFRQIKIFLKDFTAFVYVMKSV